MVLNASSSGCMNSAICFQDFIKRKTPAKKVKLRSLQSTLSNLLLGAVKPEISEHVLTEIDKIEEEVSNGKRMFPDEFSSGSPVFGKSKRTEDIFIREDEDGIRSHFCPLDSKRDGVKDENRHCLDSDAENEFDNCSNVSWDETVPFVSAVERPSSESEGDSSDDSLKYAPLENQPTGENSPILSPIRRILQLNQITERTSLLDKRTMEAWLEDSSDEYEAPIMKDPELPHRNTIGNESDMEEFEKDSETETENGNLETIKDSDDIDKKDEGNKDFLIGTKSSENDIENESNKQSSHTVPEDEHLEGEHSGGNRNSLNNPDENENNDEKHSETESTTQDFQNEQKLDFGSEIEKENNSCEHDVLDYFPLKTQTEEAEDTEKEIKEPFKTNLSESKKKSATQAVHGDNSHEETSDSESELTSAKSLIVNEVLHNELTPGEIPATVTRSDVFEPVLIQEHRALTKPRNKFAKLFQSFKKKLERNKKA